MTVKQYKAIVKTHEALESARKLILELNSGCMVLQEGETVQQKSEKVIDAIDEAILEGLSKAQVSPQIASEPVNHKPVLTAIINFQAKSFIRDLKDVVDAFDASRQEDTSGAYASGLSDGSLASSEPPKADPAPAKPSTLSDLEQAGDVARYIREKGYKMGAVAWDLFCDNFSSYVKFENPGLLG